MILRTYWRRSRSFSDGGGGVSSSQDASDFDAAADVLGSSASQPLPLPLPPSQESSSMWEFDEDPPPSPPRPRQEGKQRGARRRGGGWELAEAPVVAPSATLTEAEEYGEMMESVDEVTFALDGLRPAAAQKRTRRASLLALLGICAAACSAPKGLYGELDQAKLEEGANLMLKVAKEVLQAQTARQVDQLLLNNADEDLAGDPEEEHSA